MLAPHDVDPFAGCLSARCSTPRGGEPLAGLMCADVGDGMVPVIDPYFGGMTVPADPVPDPDAPSCPAGRTVDYPHGTLMLLRRACLDEVGVFDERYFSYCEEADLALRARRAGWKVGLVRGARVQNIHLGFQRGAGRLPPDPQHAAAGPGDERLVPRVRPGLITVVQVARGVRDPSTRPLVFDARARLRGLRDFVLRRFGPPPPDVLPAPAGAGAGAPATGPRTADRRA